MQDLPPPCLENGVIRMCHEKDYFELEAIYAEQEGVNMPLHYFNDFRKAIRSGDYLVAEIDGQVVAGGGVHYYEYNHQGSLFFGIVKRSMQRRGLGTAMLLARILLLPINPGTFVSLHVTPWSQPFYSGFGFQWFLQEKGLNGILLTCGTLSVDSRTLEAIDQYFQHSNLEIACTTSDFAWPAPNYEPLPEGPLETKTPEFKERPFSSSDRRFLERIQRQIKREKTKLRRWTLLTILLFLAAGAVIAIRAPWDLMLFLILVFGSCCMIIRSFWSVLCNRDELLLDALHYGTGHELKVDGIKIWQLSSHEPFYGVDLPTSEALILRGKCYRKSGRFPCLKFSILRYTTSDGRLAHERIRPHEKRTSPDYVILSNHLNSMVDMPHLTLIEGSMETTIRRLGTAPSKTADEETSN